MNRIRIAFFLIICLFLLLGLGIFNLEVIETKKFKELSNRNCIRLLPQKGARGDILDRDGNQIVNNELVYNVMILPEESIELDKLLLKVSKVLGATFKDLKDAFRNGYIAPSVFITIAKNIDIKKAIALEELKTDIPGIIIQPEPQRHYPYGRLACHLLGYLGEIDHWRLTKLEDYGYKTKDIVGFGGVEEKYDYYLRQEEGGLLVEVDHRGRFTRILGFKPPRGGRNLQLSISLKIQKIAQDNLSEQKGSVIIMDPYTGEIIALVSSPNFNPAIFVDKKASVLSGIIRDAASPLVNRAISSGYPAGSVFKPVVACAGLETAKVNTSTSFFCSGSVLIGRQKFDCWDRHNLQNLSAAIAHSCNVFFYRLGLALGPQNIYDYGLKFGLSRPTCLDLPYEASGFIPSPLWRKIHSFRNWFDGDTANLSIGQAEVLVTPLQIARMMAVFANKGYLVTPYLAKAIDGRDISSYQRKTAYLNFKPSTIDYIRQGLRKVVLDTTGTANILSGLAVPVAGKTGTAQAPPGSAHAWFAGFFPFKSPKYVICVFLERGGSGYNSCVVAKQIIEAMINEGLI